MASCRLTVLCSGSGTNLQALLDAHYKNNKLPNVSFVHVFVNRKNVAAIDRAAQYSIPTTYFNLIKDGYIAPGVKDASIQNEARRRYDADLADLVLKDNPNLVVLAGWMHVFTPSFLDPLEKAGVLVINLHPALPGRYDGANAIGRAYEDFQAGKLENNVTGAMIHYVVAEVDRGQPIIVEEVECREGDTLEDLETRLHETEHRIIVEATRQVVDKILQQ